MTIAPAGRRSLGRRAAWPLWLLALLALAAASLALAQMVVAGDGEEDDGLLDPGTAPLPAAFLLLSALLLARCPAAFGYSSALAAGVFAGLALATAALVDAALVPARPSGWVRGLAIGLAALAAVLFALKRWAWLTGLRRVAAIAEAGAGDSGASQPVRVLSWNVYLRSVAREEILDDDAKNLRAARLADPRLSPLRDADLVCMQEFVATANYRLHRLLDAAPAMGFRAAVTPSAPRLLSPAIADSGLVVLSKLPGPVAVRGRELRGAVGPDRLMAKAVDAITLGTGPGRPPLLLVHAHMQSGYTRIDDARVEAAKRTQLGQIARAWRGPGSAAKPAGMKGSELGEGATKGSPRLLCGDLNWDALEPGRHAELMATLQIPPEADLLLGRKALSARPATIRVTYDDRTGRELDVNYYDRRVPDGATRLPRSVDYILLDGGRAPRSAGSATAVQFPPPRGAPAEAVQFPPPRGAPAMSDHLAVRADVMLP